MNRYPLWKYVLVALVVVLAFIYSLPNLYGEDPALQISAPESGKLTNLDQITVMHALKQADITPKAEEQEGHTLLVRFGTEDDQSKAKMVLEQALPKGYTVALNLSPAAPAWLLAIGANPMKLGLDLRGGIHFLLAVDVNSVIQHREQGAVHGVGQVLRDKDLRYAALMRNGQSGVDVYFRDSGTRDDAYTALRQAYPDFVWIRTTKNGRALLQGTLSAAEVQKIRENTMQQAIMTLRRRVNELGVSETIVQQQGLNRVSVDLPGMQNAARAQNIIGKTATLEFHMVDTTHDVSSAMNGVVPMGAELLYTREGHRPVLLHSKIILKGSSITSATSSIGQNGRPQVNVRLGGGGSEEAFARATTENVGNPMAVVYNETVPHIKTVNGKMKITYTKTRDIINVATIQQPLGNAFQITNLSSMREASDLALLLRAGSLPTSVSIIEEQSVGPSLGAANIEKGIYSVVGGLLIIVVFMLIYYRAFGLIANFGLVVNLFFTVAILSLLGAVLTLPGIAGMVLTVGMAIDANVLINERIREELRNGLSVAASIHAGYERALATIIDSHVTTLIAAIVLLSIGSGPVKSFAVTLTIGILTSMFTAFMVTRSLVNAIYGGRKLKKLSIGINVQRLQQKLSEKRQPKND